MRTPSLQAGAKAAPKRIIVCCDGTWMDSLGKKGYVYIGTTLIFKLTEPQTRTAL